MKKDNLIQVNINLLKHFEMHKSQGHNLFCSYMHVSSKYKNELFI